MSATPLQSSEDERSGAVMVFRDITNLQKMEKMREEWASVIAHDLRQPVNVIALAAHILRERCRDKISDIEAVVLARIDSSAANLSRMIDDLLDTSCIEASRLSMEKAKTDLPTLIRETVSQLQESTFEHHLEVATCEHRHAVHVDPKRLLQVVSNPVCNAVKYGDPNSPVEVDLKCANGELVVSVSNFGPGIGPEHMPHLFDRFYRVPGKGYRPPGIGLGLYICKGIVEAHEGRIWSESVPGRRTVFFFSLPELREELERMPRAG